MNAWIADDEPLALAKLKLFLSQLGDVTIDREFGDGTSLLAALLDTPVEQLPAFLVTDIQMPGMTGIEVLERLPVRLPVIVTSAWEQYALPSWTLRVTDYLLKPFSRERLAQAVSHVRETIRLQELDKAHPQNVLQLRSEGLTVPVNPAEVACLEARGDSVLFVRPGQKTVTVTATLSSFESRLPAPDFIRIHRSFIINIRQVVTLSSREIVLQGGIRVPVGRTYRDKISLITENLTG